MMADDEQRKKNVRMALVLASIVVIFFVGFIAKTWLMGR
ncbi:cytochrome oxidase small assembly protein [Caenimonas sedimenti]